MLLYLFFKNELILISNPARNIKYKIPVSDSNLILVLSSKIPMPLGPIINPLIINTKIDGILNHLESNGTSKRSATNKVNTTTGSVIAAIRVIIDFWQLLITKDKELNLIISRNYFYKDTIILIWQNTKYLP